MTNKTSASILQNTINKVIKYLGNQVLGNQILTTTYIPFMCATIHSLCQYVTWKLTLVGSKLKSVLILGQRKHWSNIYIYQQKTLGS